MVFISSHSSGFMTDSRWVFIQAPAPALMTLAKFPNYLSTMTKSLYLTISCPGSTICLYGTTGSPFCLKGFLLKDSLR